MITYIAVLLVAAATQSHAQDRNLCPEMITSGSLPKLPDQWITEFEVAYWLGNSQDLYYEAGIEAFDSNKNRSAYAYSINGYSNRTYQVISDYVNGKSYTIHHFVPFYEPDACVTGNLVKSQLPVNNGIRSGKIPVGPMLVMYLTGSDANVGPMYARKLPSDDTVTFRDMKTVRYSGCHYHQPTRQTFKVTWHYITEAGTSIMIPVGALVTISNPLKLLYENLRYDFIAFDSNKQAYDRLVTQTKIYEVPLLHNCQIKPPPAVSFPDVSKLTVQSYSIEYITMDQTQAPWMTQQFEKFNYDKKYYMEKGNVLTDGVFKPVRRVSDYSTGVRYNIDRFTGDCTVAPLDRYYDPVAEHNGDGVCMKNPDSFFGTKINYTYDGLRTFRGIECHVWTADTVAYNGAVTERVQWCLASDHTVAGSHPNQPIVPVQLVTAYNYSNTFVLLLEEVFSFETSEPPLYAYDISECYRALGLIRHFVVKFPNTVAEFANADPILFQTSFIQAVQSIAKVNENRIINVRVENSDTTDVTFSLLPQPPKGGLSETKCPPTTELSIDDAINNIRAAVTSGGFTVSMNNPASNGSLISVTAHSSSESFYEAPRRTPQAWFIGHYYGEMIAVGLSSSLIGFLSALLTFFCIVVPHYEKKAMMA